MAVVKRFFATSLENEYERRLRLRLSLIKLVIPGSSPGPAIHGGVAEMADALDLKSSDKSVVDYRSRLIRQCLPGQSPFVLIRCMLVQFQLPCFYEY